MNLTLAPLVGFVLFVVSSTLALADQVYVVTPTNSDGTAPVFETGDNSSPIVAQLELGAQVTVLESKGNLLSITYRDKVFIRPQSGFIEAVLVRPLEKMIVTASTEVRSNPANEAGILMWVKPGNSLVYWGQADGDWRMVSSPNGMQTGWVHSLFLRRAPTAPSLATVPPSSESDKAQEIPAQTVALESGEQQVEKAVTDLVGQPAFVHIRRWYRSVGEKSFGWKGHYFLMEFLAEKGIVTEVFQAQLKAEIEASNSCRGKTGMCIHLRDHSRDAWEIFETLESQIAVEESRSDEFATFRLGAYESIRIIEIGKNVSEAECDWDVTFRAWFKDGGTVIAQAIRDYTGLDGYMQRNCYYLGKDGLVWKYNTMIFP